MAAAPSTSAMVAVIVAELMDLDDESEEDEEMMMLALMGHHSRSLKRGAAKPGGCATTAVPHYQLEDFKEHFRMNKQTFVYLSEAIAPFILCDLNVTRVNSNSRRPSLPVQYQMLIATWLLANQESFRDVGDRFGVCRITAWKCLMRVAKALLRYSEQEGVISWPSQAAALENAQSFYLKYGFPGVIGCIGCKHMAIKAPEVNAQSFVNRKGFHSTVLQAVCNERMQFTHCHVGEAGSVRDATVFMRSDVFTMARSGRGFPDDTYLLGDGSYPLMKHVITPYRDNGRLSVKEHRFNARLSKCHTVIAAAFARLTGRFQRLNYLDMSRMDLLIMVITASCVFHNVCISQGDLYEDEDCETKDKAERNRPTLPSSLGNVTDVREKREGAKKRSAIVDNL